MPAQMIPGSVELLRELQAQAGVWGAVIVQPGNYGYNHEYILECCRRFPGRFAAVCLVDPQASDAPCQLERLVRDEGCGGLRLRPLFTPDDWRWLSDRHIDPLWRAAEDLGVPISLLVWPNQVEAVGEMAARFPGVRVIIDHLGRQRPAESPDYPGAESLLRLADCPNTYVKASALSAASTEPYPHPDAVALVRRVFERFGARRMLWGTDFPYVQLKEGYGRALELVDRYTFLSPDDREWLLGRTAAGLYSFERFTTS
jgi:predicted TIM-barrel fold metal-dependent hydrolase